ncbi:MAG: hypothetical protein NT166_06595 [Candidatus Aminicenantes bacterium]|nr:hypothetical protein [Candidatus Aminicenantes bacterium]
MMQTMVIDSEEKAKEKKPQPGGLKFKIDDSLEDIVPFADIVDSKQFVDKLRKDQWQ